jgi:hypothetical protein
MAAIFRKEQSVPPTRAALQGAIVFPEEPRLPPQSSGR